MSKQRSYPPGPKGIHAWRAAYQVVRDPVQFCLDARSCPDRIRHLRLGGQHVYLLYDPELIREVLVGHPRECIKNQPDLKDFKEFVGDGLFTLEGEPWRKRRKLIAPALQPKRMGAYVDVMQRRAHETFLRYRNGEARDFEADCMWLTLAISAETLLGSGINQHLDRLYEIVDVAAKYLSARSLVWNRIVPSFVPTAAQLRFRKALRDLDEIVYAIIAELRRSGLNDEDHLLARLMRLRDEDGKPLTDRELREETITMLVAGRETVALTLTHAAYELARDPELAERVRVEVESICGGAALTGSQVQAFQLLDAVVRETLRVYPPAFSMTRVVAQAIELDGYVLAPGSLLMFSQLALQRDPRNFRDAERFDPARWLQQPAPPRAAFIPFGDGPRSCIGLHYSMVELKVVLATLLRFADIELVPGYELRPQPLFMLRPYGGLPLKLKPRRAGNAELIAVAEQI